MQLALPQQAVSHSARLSGGRPAGLSRRPAIRLGNAARRSEAPSASAIRAVSSHAAPGPHSAALAPARAPVFQLSIAAAPAQPRPSLPPQSLAIGGIQIPNSLVYTLIGFLGAFWACFFCVLLALFPTLHEVWHSAREVRRCARSVITCCAEVEDLARDVRVQVQGATQGLDALKTIPSSVGQQLYSIVNWDTDPRYVSDDDEEPDKMYNRRRGSPAFRGGRGGGGGKPRPNGLGLRTRVAEMASQVSRVAGRLADALGPPNGKKAGAAPREPKGQGSSAAEAASGQD